MKVEVVKIGGALLADRELLHTFLEEFQRLPALKILVHGGGNRAGTLCAALNLPVEKIDGRRVTTGEVLEVVTMVYAGSLNKQLVADLQALGVAALGLSGADGNLIRAEKRPVKEHDFGFAGDVREVNTILLKQLLHARLVPVCCAITHDGKGQLLNTNADTIAATLATALADFAEVQLTYVFDRPGVLTDSSDDTSVLPELNHASYEQLRASGAIHTGMLPKLSNCFDALRRGVAGVRLCNAAGLRAGGTKILL